MSAVTDLPSKVPTPKVLAAGGGAGLGAATADLVLWALAAAFADGGDLPWQVEAWVRLALPIILATTLGYWMPRGLAEVAPFRRRGEHEADL